MISKRYLILTFIRILISLIQDQALSTLEEFISLWKRLHGSSFCWWYKVRRLIQSKSDVHLSRHRKQIMDQCLAHHLCHPQYPHGDQRYARLSSAKMCPKLYRASYVRWLQPPYRVQYSSHSGWTDQVFDTHKGRTSPDIHEQRSDQM